MLAQKDTIVLHRLQEPPWQAFDAMVKQAEKQATNHDAAMQGIAKFLKKMKYGAVTKIQRASAHVASSEPAGRVLPDRFFQAQRKRQGILPLVPEPHCKNAN